VREVLSSGSGVFPGRQQVAGRQMESHPPREPPDTQNGTERDADPWSRPIRCNRPSEKNDSQMGGADRRKNVLPLTALKGRGSTCLALAPHESLRLIDSFSQASSIGTS
jgi:hypothetical protein